MKVLHLLALGGAGGIESLCSDTAKYSKDENHFYFLWGGGKNADIISELTENITVRKFQNKNFFIEIKYFWNYCSVNKIECIICQGVSPMMLLFCYLTKIFHPKIKLVLYAHANAEDLFYRKIERILFKLAYRHANGCIVISKSVWKSLRNYIKDNGKIKLIYNGTDINKFQIESSKANSEKLKLIYIGRLKKTKGIDLLLKAFSLLDDVDALEIEIIGDGSERSNLEQLSKQLGIDKNVNFRGTQWNVNEWLGNADIFVHPAIWNEGFGISLIEAMAAGVPCIAFNRGAIPEIITDNKNGFIENEISAEALSLKIKYVLNIISNDSDKWKGICLNARKRAEEFSIKSYVSHLSSYIKTL